jgi:hypothetical protein
MYWLSEMLRDGEGCTKDFRQAVIWDAQAGHYANFFWSPLSFTRLGRPQEPTEEELGCYFDQLCYALGWGLYWYMLDKVRDVSHTSWLDYYYECVELQQKSIFTFLLCWNQTTAGVKGPGQMIAQMVWDAREDNLLKTFELREAERQDSD